MGGGWGGGEVARQEQDGSFLWLSCLPRGWGAYKFLSCNSPRGKGMDPPQREAYQNDPWILPGLQDGQGLPEVSRMTHDTPDGLRLFQESHIGTHDGDSTFSYDRPRLL